MRLLWVIARNGDRTELDMSIPCLKVRTWGTESSLYHLSQKQATFCVQCGSLKHLTKSRSFALLRMTNMQEIRHGIEDRRRQGFKL